MIKSQDMEFTFGLMEEPTLEDGLMVNKMTLEFISYQMVRLRRVDGKETKELIGLIFQRRKKNKKRRTMMPL